VIRDWFALRSKQANGAFSVLLSLPSNNPDLSLENSVTPYLPCAARQHNFSLRPSIPTADLGNERNGASQCSRNVSEVQDLAEMLEIVVKVS